MAAPANLQSLLGTSSMERLMKAAQGRNQLTVADSMNAMQKYFGPLRTDFQPGAFDELAVTSYQLPDAYKGRNLFLKETVVGLVTQGNEWYTTLALPWAHTNEHHFTWTEWKFNMTLAGEVPPEGIPRLITSSQRQFARHTMRRGLAFMLEHGFWQTDQGVGQEQYRRNMQGIRAAVQETQNYDVSFEIANCHNYWKEWQERKGLRNVSAAKLMQLETSYFAILNKSAKHFDLMMTNLLKTADTLGVKPNLLIAPTDFRMYYAHVDAEKTTFWSYGPDGILVLKQGPDAATRVFDMLVVETRRLDISDQEPPIEPFLRIASYGEYYKLMDAYKGEDHSGYSKSWMNTVLWDEQRSGDFVKVTWDQAFKYVHRFNDDEDGMLRAEHQTLADQSSDKARAATTVGEMYPGYNPILVGRGMTAGSQKARFDKLFRDMFLFWADENRFEPVTYFGLMEGWAASTDAFRDVAYTAAQATFPKAALDDARRCIDNLLDLVAKSEKMSYNAHWEMEEQRVNYDQQVNTTTNAFQGQPTAEDVAAHRGLPRILEAVPNRFGSMRLPPKNAHPSFADYYVPPNLSDYPALATLADERGKNNGWDESAVVADEGLQVLNRIVRTLARIMGSSLFIDPLNRPPWFPVAQSETTLVSEVLVGPRDGVFMRFLPALWAGRGAATARRTRIAVAPDVQASVLSRTDIINALLGDGAAGPNQPYYAAFNEMRNGLALELTVAADALRGAITALPGGSTAGLATATAQQQSDYQSAVQAEDIARKRLYDYLQLVLWLATDQLPMDAEAEGKKGKSVMARLRNILRHLFKMWRTPNKRNEFLNLLTMLEPLFNDQDRGTTAAVARASTTLSKLMNVKQMETIVAGPALGPATAPETDESPGVPTIGPGGMAAYRQYARGVGPDYHALLNGLQQLESQMQQAMPYVLSTTWRQGAASSRTLDVMAAFAALNEADPAQVSAAGASLVASFKALWASLQAPLRTILDSLTEDNQPSGDGGQAAGANIEVTAAAYDAGVWVRVPRSSNKVWAETALQEQYPLALPSNPFTAHTSPVGADVDTLTPQLLDRLLKRPQYTATVKDQEDIDLQSLNAFQAMEKWQIPGDVLAGAAPSTQDSIMTQAQKRARPDSSSRGLGGSGGPGTAVAAYPSASIRGQGPHALMAGLLAQPDIQEWTGRPEPLGPRGIDGRDAQPQDRRGEYRDFRKRHADGARYPTDTADSLGGGSGTGAEAIAAAKRYPTFVSTFSDFHKRLRQTIFTSRWQDGNKTTDPLVRLYHQVLLGCMNIERQWMDLYQNSVLPPAGIILWRLWITRRMHQMPIMVGGLDTGATLYGNVSVLLGDDVASKIHYANLTFTSTSIIVEPRNVIIAENVMADEYLWGNGTRFIQDARQVTWDSNRPPADMIATLVPYEEQDYLDPMSFYGQFATRDFKPNYLNADEKDLHWTSAPYYDLVFSVSQALQGVNQSEPEAPRYGMTQNFNLIAFWGWQARFNKVTESYSTFHTPVNNHTGANGVGPLAAAVFNGNRERILEVPTIPALC